MSGEKLLLIDDDQAVRVSFRSYLEDEGYRILEAENGRIGLELFRAESPDLILVDLRMPEVGGLEVLESVSNESPDTPVIVVSGMGTLRDSVSALRLGAWDYLIKPIEELDVLANSIHHALERVRLRRENRLYREHLEDLVSERTAELQKRTEEAKNTADKLRIFSLAVDQSSNAVILTDTAGNIEYVNSRFTDLTGYTAPEVLGRNPRLLKGIETPRKLYREMWRTIKAGQIWSGELMNRRKDGEGYWVKLTVTPISTEEGVTHFLAIQEDVTTQKQYELKLLHQAHHDVLTGLPNRLLAIDRLKQSVALAERERVRGALLYLDLDGFKEINDSAGHETGDEVLVTLSKRLPECVRASDTVARIGGDEFVVILHGLEHGEQSRQIAEKIRNAFLLPVHTSRGEHSISVSIGICTYPDDGEDPMELLRKADIAMYRAKQLGRNRCEWYGQTE